MKVHLILGDSLTEIKKLPDESVDCCITSPPYWGLRDYGTGAWEGGDSNCDHSRKTSDKIESSTLQSNATNQNHDHEGWRGGVCGKCGAQRVDNQIGLEKTPQEYVDKMVEVFREVRRVLRKDGTLWLNLGDSYAGNREKSGDAGPHATCGNTKEECCAKFNKVVDGLKPKDLVGIPWMVAFALRADGWYLRQDIIWSKKNCMPESVTDRCTKSHEYIFLLSKNQTYFYDNDAIKEPCAEVSKKRAEYGWNCNRPSTKNASMNKEGIHTEKMGNRFVPEDGRNKRSVWTVATKPFKDAHFATFPKELITPCVLAGCPKSGTILDPFSGAGTTGVVAKENNRNYIGIELNPEYVNMSKARIDSSVSNSLVDFMKIRKE